MKDAMRKDKTKNEWAVLLTLLAAACGASTSGVDDSSVDNGAIYSGKSATVLPDDVLVALDADGGIPLDCPHGGAQSVVTAVFRCDIVISYTCKDLSNIVLEFEDGTRERFEGQNGHTNAFSGTGANAGKLIARVWVKAGANHSGDGPGYGERFEAPVQACLPPAAGSGGDGPCVVQPDGTCIPVLVTGGVGGGCVVGPDNTCGTSGPVAGSGGSNGNAPL